MKLSKFRNLPWRLFFIFLLVAVGIGVNGYTYLRSLTYQVKAQKQNELAAIGKLKVEQIVNWRTERFQDAFSLMADHSAARTLQSWLINPQSADLKSDLFTWLDSFLANPTYSSIFFLDLEGKPLLALPESAQPSGAVHELIALARRENKPQLSDFYQNSVNRKISLNLIAPILNPQQDNTAPVAFVLLTIDARQFLAPLIETWPTPSDSAETVLVRRDGDAVLFLNDLRRKKDSALTLCLPLSDYQLPAQRAVLGEEGVIEGVDYGGVPVLAAMRTIPNSPWALVAKVDLAELYAPLEQSSRIVGIAIMALILAAGAAIGMVWRQQRILFYKEQYVVEHAQRLLAQRYEILNRYANDIFLLATVDGQIVDVNKRAEEAYGYTRDELLGLNISQLRAPDLALSSDEWNRQIEKQGMCLFETVHLRKDGRSFPVEVSANIIQVDHDRLLQEIIRDITTRRQAETAIQQLNAELETRVQQRTAQLESMIRELEAFSYSVSHDLRTPLRSIDGFSRILVDEYSANLAPDAIRYLGIVRQNAQQMGRLIDDLLLFSRLNRQSMRVSQVDMRLLVNQALELLQHECQGRQVEISIGDLPACEGDVTLLRQVWINLISNSLKYTRARAIAKIEIGVIQKESSGEQPVIYFIKDNGTGFDMLYSHKLFGVFQRLHRAEDYEGNGVGLANVQRVLARHGGHAWADAQVDQGATFYFMVHDSVAA